MKLLVLLTAASAAAVTLPQIWHQITAAAAAWLHQALTPSSPDPVGALLLIARWSPAVPIITAVIQRSGLSKSARTAIGAAVSCVSAMYLLAQAHLFTYDNVASGLIEMTLLSAAFYEALLQPSGIAPWVEQITSNAPTLIGLFLTDKVATPFRNVLTAVSQLQASQQQQPGATPAGAPQQGGDAGAPSGPPSPALPTATAPFVSAVPDAIEQGSVTTIISRITNQVAVDVLTQIVQGTPGIGRDAAMAQATAQIRERIRLQFGAGAFLVDQYWSNEWVQHAVITVLNAAFADPSVAALLSRCTTVAEAPAAIHGEGVAVQKTP